VNLFLDIFLFSTLLILNNCFVVGDCHVNEIEIPDDEVAVNEETSRAKVKEWLQSNVHEQDLKHQKGLHPHEKINNCAFPTNPVCPESAAKVVEPNCESLVKLNDQQFDSSGKETSRDEIQTDETIATSSMDMGSKMTITNLHSEKHGDKKGNFQNKSSQCIQTKSLVCPQAKSVLCPGEKHLHDAINIARPGRANIIPHNISNGESEDKVSKALLELTTVPPKITRSFSPRRARRGLGTGQNMVRA
jgi:hypothetical protein